MEALTFGIELEVLVIVPPFCKEQAGKLLHDAMLDTGIPATGYEDDEDDFECFDPNPPFSRWRVSTDCLALSSQEMAHVPDGWTPEAIELSSRKFDFYKEDWRSEVGFVLQLLRELEAHGWRFITNRTTGFHVHVGNGDNLIPLHTAKNVFQLMTAHERTLDNIHAVSRIQVPSPAVYHHYYYPLSFFHRNASDPEGSNENLFDWLANIEEGINTYSDLDDFFNCLQRDVGIAWDMTGHNSTCNFDNLFECEEFHRYEDTLTGTIEFRQHAGTIDFMEIVSWVMLVCNIVSYCDKVADEEFIWLCLRAGEDKFNLEDLFAALDTNEDVMDHYLNHGSSVGGVIGGGYTGHVLPEGTFNAFIEQNDHEASKNSEQANVKETIKIKYESGDYGLNSQFEMEITPEDVYSSLREAAVILHSRGVDVSDEVGREKVRAMVLRRFARQAETMWAVGAEIEKEEAMVASWAV